MFACGGHKGLAKTANPTPGSPRSGRSGPMDYSTWGFCGFMMRLVLISHATEEDLEAYYEKMKGVYPNIFETVGLGSDTPHVLLREAVSASILTNFRR